MREGPLSARSHFGLFFKGTEFFHESGETGIGGGGTGGTVFPLTVDLISVLFDRRRKDFKKFRFAI